MYVVKRDGRKEEIRFDKIKSRIEDICYKYKLHSIDAINITSKVTQGLYKGVTTVEVDNLVAETAVSLSTVHPDYAALAAQISISNMHAETINRFSLAMAQLYHFTDPVTKKHRPMITELYYKIISENADKLDSAINYERDFNLSYFSFKTLESSYLLKINGKIAERPQQMLMRVAVCIHGRDIDAAIQTYDMMSLKYFTHASPTLFNACLPKSQLSSCFLLTIKEDSLEGIYDSLKQCATISKYCGGIGININNIRAKHSYIAGINGSSSGIVPMLKVFNDSAKYVSQMGKRPSALAIYLEPWHADIYEFLDLRKNTGAEENRARDLFTALWIPDLFMERVLQDEEWSLMCPNSSPGLADCWGDEFNRLYISYELKNQFVKKVKARDLFHAIYVAQVETGSPFMLYKDACNRKSNQQNLGTIKSSNLCTEIVEYSSSDEIGVCNLASIGVNNFVKKNGTYNFGKLKEVTKIVARNLNKIIDLNYYPLSEAEKSNKRHRPIGIGVQGLADAFILMRLPFDSPEARKLNIQIFETLYYGALEASCELAKEFGTYETYNGSPISKGILQYEMWDTKPTELWDWSALKKKIAQYGVRNSLLIAVMPTASTAQILGNAESIEPYTSNMYCRRVSSGEFQVINDHLVRDLIANGLWNEKVKNNIVANGGSIQNINEIPKDLKLLYRTVWEVPIRSLLKMAADRGAFIDQSQSLNIYIARPTYQHLTTIHIYGWKLGLKTGMYYLRTKPAAQAIQFTVDKTKSSKTTCHEEIQICALNGKDTCGACSG